MSIGEPLRLGVNVDHVGTVRNARGGNHPDPVAAARVAAAAGADGITMHLREDRRHIIDADVYRVKEAVDLPLNFEMAATDEMVGIALDLLPHACCLVPEKREERTTEGGLDVVAQTERLGGIVGTLQDAGIRVSLFIEAAPAQLEAARSLGADIVELHTGAYAELAGAAREAELAKIETGAALAARLGLECHAGHGLTYDNVSAIARLPQVVELNIGHFLIGEAITAGLPAAIAEMRQLMEAART